MNPLKIGATALAVLACGAGLVAFALICGAARAPMSNAGVQEIVFACTAGATITALCGLAGWALAHGPLRGTSTALPPPTGLDACAAESSAARQMAVMCHEMRTSLSAVIGFSSLALEADIAPRPREHVLRAQQAGEHLLHVVDNALVHAKLRAGRLVLASSLFELRTALQQVLDLAGANAGRKGLPLVFSVADDVPSHLVGDRSRLTQVLLNLADNAIKFTEHGCVDIQVSTVERTARRTQLCFAVEDTGAGIPADDIARIFHPYEQGCSNTDAARMGTGLGLAIVREIVRCMGGEVSVHSCPGQGSRFSFTVGFETAAPQHRGQVHRTNPSTAET